MDKNISTNYVQHQPPYWIIKHGNKIGVQIGIQRVIISGGTPFKTETHDYPVVVREEIISSFDKNKPSYDVTSDGEMWDNVEIKQVSVLCKVGDNLSWMDFIKILWHDHDRFKLSESLQKELIAKKLIKYNKYLNLPSSGTYTIHLHTESIANEAKVVCSARDDIFALNILWSDNLAVLEQQLVFDLLGYLPIISPGRLAKWWRMTYATDEEALQPLVDRLNANEKATAFRNTITATFTVSVIPPYEDLDGDMSRNNSTQPNSQTKIWNINEDELRKHFKPIFTRKSHDRDDSIPILIGIIQNTKTDKGIGQIALQTYESDYFNKDVFTTFMSWYREFCNIVGATPNDSYKKSDYIIKDKKQLSSFAFLKKVK